MPDANLTQRSLTPGSRGVTSANEGFASRPPSQAGLSELRVLACRALRRDRDAGACAVESAAAAIPPCSDGAGKVGRARGGFASDRGSACRAVPRAAPILPAPSRQQAAVRQSRLPPPRLLVGDSFSLADVSSGARGTADKKQQQGRPTPVSELEKPCEAARPASWPAGDRC